MKLIQIGQVAGGKGGGAARLKVGRGTVAVQAVGARVERLVGRVRVLFLAALVDESVGEFGQRLLGLLEFAGEEAGVWRG